MAAYVVTAGYVTATTAVGAGRAAVDIARGAVLPADVPAAEVAQLVLQGRVEEIADQVEDLTGEGQGDAGETVPEGSVAKVLEWVGGDKARAEQALAAEQARPDADRKTLVDALTKLLEA